jgi:hypothetical protein
MRCSLFRVGVDERFGGLGKVHLLEEGAFHNLLLRFVVSNSSEEFIQLIKNSSYVQVSHWTDVDF